MTEGFDAALYDKPRSGKPPSIKMEEKARITASAWFHPPAGHADWTLCLLADKAVELGFVQQISQTEVGRILKKTRFRPHLKKPRCIGAISAEYLARMEDLLLLYNLPYDARRPVICLDELSIQLLGEKGRTNQSKIRRALVVRLRI